MKSKDNKIEKTIVAKAKALGASLAGIAAIDDLKASPSYEAYDKTPFYEEYKGVKWRAEHKSVLVWALVHPASEPVLDWWSMKVPGFTPGTGVMRMQSKKLRIWLGAELGINALSKAPLRNAPRGQDLWQGLSQPMQGSKSIGPVGSSSASRKIPRRRTRVPNSGVTKRLFLPITPRPARWAESLRKAPPNSIWYGSERALMPRSSPNQIRSCLDCRLITLLPGVKPGTFILHQSSAGSDAG